MNRTKIIATIGPGCDDRSMMQKLVDAGVSCFRINLSHGSENQKKHYFSLIKSLKTTSGSYISFLSYCLIKEKNGNHLFILPDKEEALYFFNDLENLFNSERGTTLLFYPASYRRPYQIMDSDTTSVLQRTEVLDALGKERKKLIVVTYPEAIVEKVIEKKNFEKNNLTISVGEELELDLIDEILIDLDFEKVFQQNIVV